jgi:hypothetical protein
VSRIAPCREHFNDDVAIGDYTKRGLPFLTTVIIHDNEITGMMTSHEMCGLEDCSPWATSRDIQHAERVEEHEHSP